MQSADFLSAVFFYLKVGENLNQNWIVENLNNAFSTWNGKLGELWGLVTTGPQTFKGGAVWSVMQTLHNGMVGIGYALVVLFFAISLFSALECAVTPLDNRARLEVLHKFFRISEEGRFNFDFDNCAKLGQDFRDSIAPDCIRFCKKHIEIEDFCAKCMTISEYPQQLDDKFISALLQQVPYIVLSIDIEPVETEDTQRLARPSRICGRR